MDEKYHYNKSNDQEGEERPKQSVTHVPAECGIMSSKELEITDIDDVKVLLKKIEDKIYSSKEIAEAYCKRSAIAHQLTNCKLTSSYAQMDDKDACTDVD